MSLSASKTERLKQITAEVQEILGGCVHPDGRPMTFSELEDDCIEAGDLLTAGVIKRRVAQRETSQDGGRCPSCQRPGERLPDDEVRVLQTDRDEVGWMEPAFYCDHWKESRIGLLANMSGPRQDVDPQPELPPGLRYQGIAETLSEIGKTGSRSDRC